MASEVPADLYQELRRIARYWMKYERPNHTLQPTAVVHEAWMRFGLCEPQFESRSHFLCAATKVIREVLCDYARGHRAQKRGPGQVTHLNEDPSADSAPNIVDILTVSQALDELQAVSERAAKVVELKYFGQLNNEEIAEILQVSQRTINRDWEYARAWLQARLGDLKHVGAAV